MARGSAVSDIESFGELCSRRAAGIKDSHAHACVYGGVEVAVRLLCL